MYQRSQSNTQTQSLLKPQAGELPLRYFDGTVEEILERTRSSLERIDRSQIAKLIDILLEAKDNERKVMVLGAGRSGLVARSFAMRLMHLTFRVHVIGETITPAMEKNDLLFAISGSGSTTVIVAAAKIAKQVGAKILALTSYPNSPLGRMADHSVVIRGRTKLAEKKDYFSRQILGVHEPLAPLGTIFETAAQIFLDALVVALMHRLGKTEEDLKRLHATIEPP
ncbi:MAG: 6-phospho-3-hexuloisomerase [Candidatus Bathyarchaeia archaeon]